MIKEGFAPEEQSWNGEGSLRLSGGTFHWGNLCFLALLLGPPLWAPLCGRV